MHRDQNFLRDQNSGLGPVTFGQLLDSLEIYMEANRGSQKYLKQGLELLVAGAEGHLTLVLAVGLVRQPAAVNHALDRGQGQDHMR